MSIEFWHCCNCGKTFDFPETSTYNHIREYDYREAQMGDYVSVCPFCGSLDIIGEDENGYCRKVY